MIDFFRNFIYYFVDQSIEIIELIIVFSVFFGVRAIVTKKNVIANCIILSVYSFLWCFYKESHFLLLIYAFFILTEVFLLYNELDYKMSVLKYIWSVIFINIIDAIVYPAVASIFSYCNNGSEILIKIFTYIIVLIFLAIINKFIKTKVQFINKIAASYYVVYLFIGIADYLFLLYLSFIMENMNKKVLSLFVSVLISLSILLQYGLIFLMNITNEGLKMQHYFNKRYLRMQQENYEYLEMRERETKKFRHDYRNHLKSLQILCMEKRYNDVERYLERISEKLKVYDKYISVGNSFVDAILNYYLQKMDKSNTKFIISGKIPQNCNIDMFDLCTIISNLLDNALEAVEKINENDRWIEMTFRYDNIMIYCNIRNPYNGELNIYKKKIVSIKNMQNHGYGLMNVQKSVEIYDGSIDIKTDNLIFEVLIALVNSNKLKI